MLEIGSETKVDEVSGSYNNFIVSINEKGIKPILSGKTLIKIIRPYLCICEY